VNRQRLAWETGDPGESKRTLKRPSSRAKTRPCAERAVGLLSVTENDSLVSARGGGVGDWGRTSILPGCPESVGRGGEHVTLATDDVTVELLCISDGGQARGKR
jgi:hypothetical protein